MKRPALQNKQVVLLRMAFRARNVLGTFEKQGPGPGTNLHEKADISRARNRGFSHLGDTWKHSIRFFRTLYYNNQRGKMVSYAVSRRSYRIARRKFRLIKTRPRTIIETARGWSPFRLPGTRSKPHAYSQMVTHPWKLLHLSNREYTNCNWRVEYENEMTPWNQDDNNKSEIYHTSLFVCSAVKLRWKGPWTDEIFLQVQRILSRDHMRSFDFSTW